MSDFLLVQMSEIRYVGLRMRVEARAAFEQAKELRDTMEEMGKEMRARCRVVLNEGGIAMMVQGF